MKRIRLKRSTLLAVLSFQRSLCTIKTFADVHVYTSLWLHSDKSWRRLSCLFLCKSLWVYVLRSYRSDQSPVGLELGVFKTSCWCHHVLCPTMQRSVVRRVWASPNWSSACIWLFRASYPLAALSLAASSLTSSDCQWQSSCWAPSILSVMLSVPWPRSSYFTIMRWSVFWFWVKPSYTPLITAYLHVEITFPFVTSRRQKEVWWWALLWVSVTSATCLQAS